MKITRVHWPRDPRFPRQPDRRGRRDARQRRHRARGGSLRRVHRRARGARTARRRQEALSRQGRAEGGRPTSTASWPRAVAGKDVDQRALDERMIDTRRHADQEPPRRQRDPRRLDGGRARRRAGRQGCRSTRYFGALAGTGASSPAAGADDEHPQRRRARRQQRRLPGVHGRAARPRRRSARRCGRAPRSSTRCARILKKRGLSTGVGDEGGFAPNLQVQPGGARAGDRGHRQGRLQGRPGRVHRARRRGQRAVGGRGDGKGAPDARTGHYASTSRARHDGRPSRWSRCTPSGSRQYPIVLDRGRPGRRRLGRLGAADAASWATACSWWATTSSSPTRRSLKRGIERRASPTAS